MDRTAYASINTQIIKQPTAIVNGKPINEITRTQYFVNCSNCKRVLVQFNPGDSLVGVINYTKTNVKEDIKYCPTCGARLMYSMDIIENKEIVRQEEAPKEN